ncbi:MAG TPA: hypothetical protein VJS20_11930 [Gemmatimonadales bacterium]|nr:hypothetical protein [Gemmatimonadales bacterium]
MPGKDERDRDWDKELAEVDRLLNNMPGHPPAPAPIKPAGGYPPPGQANAGHAPRVLSTREWAGTWIRVGLGLLIGIGMTQWPYTHGCGFKLWFYLVGVAAVLTAGVWSSISSWRRHLAWAHIFSQGLIIWGLVLAAREVLPRVGYALHSATWLCP